VGFDIVELMQDIIEKINNWLKTGGVDALIIIVIGLLVYVVLGFVLRRLLKHVVYGTKQQGMNKNDIKKRQQTVVALFNGVWRAVVLIVVALTLLRKFFPEFDLSPLFASAGLFGIALGFGAQSLMKDFLSGIFIISDNQYRVGDVVQIDDAKGTVERIGTRSTVLRDVEGNVHYIPNGLVQHVINKTMGYSMSRFRLAIDPATNIDIAIETINQIGQDLASKDKWKDKILEAPAFTNVEDITGTSIVLIVAGKTEPSDQWAVTAEMRKRIIAEFEKKKLKLARQEFTASAITQQK
jgi:small conductance mechanosensitive channel